MDQAMFHRYIVEQQKILDNVIHSLQIGLIEKENQMTAIRADRDALQRHASTMQNNFLLILDHLTEVTACVQRQRDAQGNSVDVAALLSQRYTLRQQAMDQERVHQFEIARLRKVGSLNDAKIQGLQNELQNLRAYETKHVPS